MRETVEVTRLRAVLRGLASALVLLVGAYVSYAFGAGYLGGVSLPTPLNIFAAVVILGAAVVIARMIADSACRPVRSPR
ncbi:MAG: hypothetical protein QOK28_1624 [Actinomycetota bacterium]|jgi:hypothetical protein